MSYPMINVSSIRKLAKENGRRVSKEFLTLVNDMIRVKVKAACEVHNGGKKTLDSAIAGMVGITGRS